jgi:hypothetical protein
MDNLLTVSRLFIETSCLYYQHTGVCCESIKYYIWSWEAEECKYSLIFEIILFQLHCWKYLDRRPSTCEELCVITKIEVDLHPSASQVQIHYWNYSLQQGGRLVVCSIMFLFSHFVYSYINCSEITRAFWTERYFGFTAKSISVTLWHESVTLLCYYVAQFPLCEVYCVWTTFRNLVLLHSSDKSSVMKPIYLGPFSRVNF